MKVEWVACDYVKDMNNRMWFVNLHAFGLQDVRGIKEISYERITKKKRIYGVLKCELCKLDMPKNQISNSVN